MFFDSSTFIGIDPTAGQKPFSYAAINNRLKLLALGEGDMEDILAFAGGQRQAYIAVCAPARPNQRLMELEEVRNQLQPPPNPGRWTNFRVAEYQLRQRNIPTPQTYAAEEDCQTWMQKGFQLFHRLERMDYQTYPHAEAALQLLEVYPFASYTSLLGHKPFPKLSLEGRLQRQLVLYDLKMDVPDPMDFFEEITQHRLRQGILPLSGIYTPGELDALIAAYTAWLAASQPKSVSLVGDVREGFVVLPCATLKENY